MGIVSTRSKINNLEAAKALAAQFQKSAPAQVLPSSYRSLLSRLESTDEVLLWRDARGRLHYAIKGRQVSAEEYLQAKANSRRPGYQSPSLRDFGYGGKAWLISQDGAETLHCNLWSADQIPADHAADFEPFVNCSFVREATPLELKLWLEGEGF